MNSINYRSINLILIEDKSLGQMSRSMVGEHLQKEVKIAPPLHGFRKNKSSPTQLISFERVTGEVDEENAIPTVYLEFNKTLSYDTLGTICRNMRWINLSVGRFLTNRMTTHKKVVF